MQYSQYVPSLQLLHQRRILSAAEVKTDISQAPPSYWAPCAVSSGETQHLYPQGNEPKTGNSRNDDDDDYDDEGGDDVDSDDANI